MSFNVSRHSYMSSVRLKAEDGLMVFWKDGTLQGLLFGKSRTPDHFT